MSNRGNSFFMIQSCVLQHIVSVKKTLKGIKLTVVMLLFLFGVNGLLYSQLKSEEINLIGTIYGQVRDTITDKSVEYATIALYNNFDQAKIFGAVTDSKGDFVLKDIPVGMYKLEISFVGYKKKHIEDMLIMPNKNIIYLGKIFLESDVTELEEVSVTGSKNEIEYKTDKTVVNIDQNIIAKGGTVIDALENVPSVKTDMEGNLTLRGSSNYTVLIDGKPTVLKGSDALQQYPSNTVEKVEIITSPSARYNPDGEVGIINVVTRKGFSDGLTGIVNGSCGLNNYYSGDIQFNYKKDKLSLAGGIDIMSNPINGNGTMDKEIYYEETSFWQNSEMDMLLKRDKRGENASLVYSFNNRNNLNANVNMGYHQFYVESNSDIIRGADTIENLTSESVNDKEDRYLETSLGYQHLFNQAGHKLEGMISYSLLDNSYNDEVFESNTDQIALLQPYYQRQQSSQEGNENKLQVKMDYSLPIKNKQMFEAGFQSRREVNDIDYDFISESTSGGVEDYGMISINRSNFALYGLYSGKLSIFNYQAGLRTEYSQREIFQQIQDSTVQTTYIDFFPSAHLAYSQGNNNQIQLSYSRRLNRPDTKELNPSLQFIDSKSQRVGNPYLNPEYINSFELKYMKRILVSFVSVELFYRQTTDKISPVWEIEDDGVLLMTYENIDRDYSLGGELMSVAQISRKCRLMLNTSLYRYNIEGDASGMEVDNASNTWNIRLGTTLKIDKTNTRMQFNVLYNSDQAGAQGSRDSFFATMAGISQGLFNNKLTATLQVKDVLSTIKYNTFSESSLFSSSLHFEPETPLISFSLSYQFNNFKNHSKKIEGMDELDFDSGFIY